MYKTRQKTVEIIFAARKLRKSGRTCQRKLLSESWQICCKWLDWILIRMQCSGLRAENGL